jgi:rubredoxin
MDKWQCVVCGYVYNPDLGDPESSISSGTPFENLPEDWKCPVCGASKGEFEKINE